MSFLSRRSAVFAVVAVLVVAVGAAAYWTAGGSGTGSASTATTSAALVVNQSTVLTAMFPGDAAQTISGTFTNPATNPGPIYVGTVTASIASVTKAGGAPAGNCDATDYTLTSETMTVGQQVAVGTGGSWTGARLQFNNKAGGNQDACKGATVTLAYAIS